ncbi:MAG: hemolysin family protein [Eubacteriales bacterium]|nr:hemolysin family protein [Eubacteriales bacterium]
MSDADPGGGPLAPILAAIWPGGVFSLLLSLLFLACYAFAGSFGAVVPRLSEEDLDDRIKAGETTAEKLKLLREDRKELSHQIITIQIFSLVFLTWALGHTTFEAWNLVFAGQTSAWPLILTIIVLLALCFLLVTLANEYSSRWAIHKGYAFAERAYPIFVSCAALLKPLSKLSYRMSLKMLVKQGIEPEDASVVIAESDLLDLLEQAQENEQDNFYNPDFLENVFSFGDKTVSECVTHRTEVVAAEADMGMDEFIDLLKQEKYTRIPVYEEDIDNIIGQVHSRDVLFYALTGKPENFSLKSFLRPLLYAPESQPISALFAQMQNGNMHMAVVIDEYGGTAGIITMENVLEELVGQIEDEYDEAEEADIIPLGEGQWLLNGSLDLEDLSRELELDLPCEEHDTVAGLVLELLDRIPEEGEKPSVRWGDYVLTVRDMDEKRVSKLVMAYQPCTEPHSLQHS